LLCVKLLTSSLLTGIVPKIQGVHEIGHSVNIISFEIKYNHTIIAIIPLKFKFKAIRFKMGDVFIRKL